jgi:hypothetical protein
MARATAISAQLRRTSGDPRTRGAARWLHQALAEDQHTMKNHDECIDITAELHQVTGGGWKGNAIKGAWNGARSAYNTVRPYVKETADVIKDLGIIGGGAYGARKAWDWATGGGQQQQAPQQPPPAGP